MEQLTVERLWAVLQEVKDPELPTVSVVEMGMVHQVILREKRVEVEMMPTFVGCPALGLIREQVSRRLLEEQGVEEVVVHFIFDPPWTSNRITEAGQKKLQEFGIAPPPAESMFVPPCPYCGSSGGDIENLFGPTACRAIYYCKRCHQPFEGMKKI